MYTLRTIGECQTQINTFLGSEYILINRFSNYDRFCEIYLEVFGKNHVADLDETSDHFSQSTYCFVNYNGIQKALFIQDYNYIVSSNGNTFCNLSMK